MSGWESMKEIFQGVNKYFLISNMTIKIDNDNRQRLDQVTGH